MRPLALGAAALTIPVLVVTGSAAATAAPTKTGFNVPVVCDNGQSFTLTNPPGRATWTPGIVSGAGGVLKPVAFTESETVYDATGAVLSSDSGTVQQANGAVQGHNPLTSVNCSNSVTVDSSQDDELLPGQTATFTLTITGYLTGRA